MDVGIRAHIGAGRHGLDGMGMGGPVVGIARGLPAGTPVLHRDKPGTILSEEDGGYKVDFVTDASPLLHYSPAKAIPYAELTQALQDEDLDDVEDELVFDGDLNSLPAQINLAGISMSWVSDYVLAPTERQYPHLTFAQTRNLSKFHFSSAKWVDSNWVDVIRKGYVWNGMRQEVQDDPEFPESTQRLPITAQDADSVTFNLSGGRCGQKVYKTAEHTATPSASMVAAALGIPGPR